MGLPARGRNTFAGRGIIGLLCTDLARQYTRTRRPGHRTEKNAKRPRRRSRARRRGRGEYTESRYAPVRWARTAPGGRIRSGIIFPKRGVLRGGPWGVGPGQSEGPGPMRKIVKVRARPQRRRGREPMGLAPFPIPKHTIGGAEHSAHLPHGHIFATPRKRLGPRSLPSDTLQVLGMTTGGRYARGAQSALVGRSPSARYYRGNSRQDLPRRSPPPQPRSTRNHRSPTPGGSK